jgi:hypothetical protein
MPNYSEVNVKGLTEEAVKAALKVEIEKFIFMNAPTKSLANNLFPTVEKLPKQDFKLNFKKQSEIKYNELGEMLLYPGDYTIPVMTFCLKLNADSPTGYLYSLNRLHGPFAKMIRQLSLKTLHRYNTKEIQILIWNILAGLRYSEMNMSSQLIINETIPEFKSQLEKSYYRELVEKWDYLAEKSHGLIPSFEKATNDYLNQLGSTGATLIEARNIHSEILKAKGDYETLRRSISNRKLQQKEKRTVWTKVSEQVYARFLTNASFNEVGALQIRVISTHRQPNTLQKEVVAVDIASLIADPSNGDVQPLALFPFYGLGGIAIESAAINPYAAAAVMAAILSAKIIDWNAFFDLASRTDKLADQAVKDMVNHGNEILNEIHDRLDKPLKESKIISGKNLSKPGKDEKTRIYEKDGGNEKLNEDFDKLSGEKSISKDGHEIKTFPNGDKVVKRPKSELNETPTLEVQPKNGAGNKVKVRYK